MGGFDFDENENENENHDDDLEEELLNKKNENEEKNEYNDNHYWRVNVSNTIDDLSDCLKDLEL